MTERSFMSASAGPVVFGLSLPVGWARVQVHDHLTTARVTLHTDDTTGPAADAVAGARHVQNGQAFGIEVPEMPDNVNVTMHGGGGTQVFQSVGTVYGSVTGMTIINGRVVSGGTGGMQQASGITAHVELPAGSSLAVVSTASSVSTFGYLDQVEFRSQSGGLEADGVRDLQADTTSGDITVGSITGQITARSVSGDIDVALYQGRDAVVETTSGDVNMQVTSRASGSVRARSVSGDVRLPGAGHLNVHAHTVSGRTRTH
ncbi:DUF4097 family beta strand repeat-containing protein [Streptomyces sp. DW26H14]|uniref:DUF4097 family beta strand repeat-containing protein n=1 Tax=Streptomyces sp. DW26H14 TaxID=3435395 RepID=UPI00403DEA01